MFSSDHAKPTDLFDFQGIRKRIFLASDYTTNDERLKSLPNRDNISTEYDELDFIDQEFESYVHPIIDQSQWITDRKYERHEIDRLGDILDFYKHKPHLNDFEKRVMKRLTRVHRAVQTEEEPEKLLKLNKNRKNEQINRLPPSTAMERIEEFLAENKWRLVDLFRTLDLSKSWNVVKEDFMRLIAREKLHMTEPEADDLLQCICEEIYAPMNYKKFAHGRSLYKKSLREVKGEPLTVQHEPNRSTHHYPVRDTTSSYVRSTISSYAKYKKTST